MSKIDEMIKRVRELNAAASPGPWEFTKYLDMPGGYVNAADDAPLAGWIVADDVEVDDGTLLAEYRTLAPKLAAMLARAMEELEDVRVSSSFRIRQDAADAIDEIEAMFE